MGKIDFSQMSEEEELAKMPGWMQERYASWLLKQAGEKKLGFLGNAGTVKYNAAAPENRQAVDRQEHYRNKEEYEVAVVQAEKTEKAKRFEVAAQIKARQKTDEKLGRSRKGSQEAVLAMLASFRKGG